MNFLEITQALKTGQMTVDCAGHCVNRSSPEKLAKYFERHCEREDENRINKNFEQNSIVKPFMSDGEYCFGCGENLLWVVTGDKLQLRGHCEECEPSPTNRFGIYDKILDPNELCEFATPKPLIGQIKITTKLVLANYFNGDDCDKENEYGNHEWCLNCTKGRKNRMEYKAQRNCAYGQTGGGTCGVFLSPDKKSIILGNYYAAEHYYDDLDDDEIELMNAHFHDFDDLNRIENHKFVDKFYMDVRRWEATDIDGLKDVPEDSVILDVAPGNWQFENYYDGPIGDYDLIMARLKLIGN